MVRNLTFPIVITVPRDATLITFNANQVCGVFRGSSASFPAAGTVNYGNVVTTVVALGGYEVHCRQSFRAGDVICVVGPGSGLGASEYALLTFLDDSVIATT